MRRAEKLISELICLGGTLRSKFSRFRMYYKVQRWVNNGLDLGDNVTIMPSVVIDDEYPYLVRIGNNCSLSDGTVVLAHDATPFKFTGGHTRLGRVILHDNVFVGSNALILPGVTIGPNVLVAAGSLVNRDIPANTCVAGVPARKYQSFEDFIEKHKANISAGPVFERDDLKQLDWELAKERMGHLFGPARIAYVKGFTGRFPYTFSRKDFL